MEQYLTVDEAAKLLRVHPETIRRMIRRGDLPFIRVGKTYRIDSSDIRTQRNPKPRRIERPDHSPLARYARPEFRHPERYRNAPDGRGGSD